MVAGGFVCLGFVTTSLASRVLQVVLYVVFLIAVGQGFANVLTRSSLGAHFDVKGFAMASGIARIGSSLSLICFPPLMQLFKTTYGWRGAMLLLGSIGAHITVSGALLIPPLSLRRTGSQTRDGYQILPDRSPEHQQDGACILASIKPICVKIEGVFDLSLMKTLNFWIVALISVTTRLNQSAWYIYFVPRTVAIGFSYEEATIMVTVAALFQLVITLLGSAAVYTEKVQVTSVMTVSVTLVAVAFFVDPWTTSWWSVSANAALFVSSMGLVFNLAEIMVKEFIGVEKMANALGWIGFLSGTVRPLAGFIPGWIYDNTGGYGKAFCILGAMQITALVPLVIKRLKQ
ncbi:monocarboxylate transporter 12-like isoform X2 [Acanthaster planci]|nr:monocarboxylate transporter 12-like isoform X2 [Acanthaster planci]